MSDKDFDLHRPTTRREVKRFEPPPWEREAFEELQRRKAEQEQAEQEQAEMSSAEEAIAQAPQQVGSEPQTAQGNATEVEPRTSEPSSTPGHAAEQKPQVPEHVVIEMMAELSAQEPSIQPAVHTVSLISALTVAAIGTVMMLWGIAALVGSRTTGAIGAFGGTVLLLFGAAAIAGAVWLAVRTLRQRGVL